MNDTYGKSNLAKLPLNSFAYYVRIMLSSEYFVNPHGRNGYIPTK